MNNTYLILKQTNKQTKMCRGNADLHGQSLSVVSASSEQGHRNNLMFRGIRRDTVWKSTFITQGSAAEGIPVSLTNWIHISHIGGFYFKKHLFPKVCELSRFPVLICPLSRQLQSQTGLSRGRSRFMTQNPPSQPKSFTY